VPTVERRCAAVRHGVSRRHEPSFAQPAADDEQVEDLVVAEYVGGRVGPAQRVDDGAHGVEQATEQQKRDHRRWQVARSGQKREEMTMKAQLGRHSDTIYALLRIVAGFLFACHGAQKLMLILSGEPSQMPVPLLWAAMIIELGGGILIAIGLFTSWAAFIASGTMAVGYFIAHQNKGLLPIQNGGELAAIYAFLFLYIAARGSGPRAVQPD